MSSIGNNKAKIKEIIPYGGIKEIAEKSGFSIFTVSRVISGKSKNRKVKATIASYLKELSAANIDLANTIASLQETNI